MGRRTRTLLTLFAILATTFAFVPAHAQRTVDIELFGSPPTISPTPIIATAGDTLKFSVINGARFQLMMYAEAGGDTPIDSGILDGASGEVSYTIPFAGGTVRFRDVLPGTSVLDFNTGVCIGACGVVTDQTTPPIAPTIDQPTRTIQEDPATITGTAEPMTVVTIDQGTSVENGKYQGQALTGPDGKWSVKTVSFGSINGTKPLIARAVRAIGYVSNDSPVVQYFYVHDAIKPDLLTFDPITSPVFSGSIHLSGTVRDNIGIRGIVLQFNSVQPTISTSNPTSSSLSVFFQLPATQCGLLPPTEQDCPIIAHAQLLTWTFDSSTLPTLATTANAKFPLGIYTVTAIAVDTSGNKRTAQLQTPLENEIIFTTAEDAVVNALPQAVQDALPSPSSAPSVPVVPPASVPSSIPSTP